MAIKIITDSAADIPKNIACEYNISVVPLGVIIDGKVLYDNVDIESREYLKLLPTLSEIPTTTMPTLAALEDELRKNLDDYEHQIFVTLSSKASGTYNGVCMLKEQIEDELGKKSNITVLDSALFSMAYGRLVIEMAKMASNGASYDEITEYFNDTQKKSHAYFCVDDLNHLKKGGRIKAGVALIGTMLGIKPILTLNEGLVDSFGKERGKLRALDKIISLVLDEADDIENETVWLVNGGADEDVELLKNRLLEHTKVGKIEECDLGCTIATHAGAGLVGISFLRK